jgi:hypothetical protein
LRAREPDHKEIKNPMEIKSTRGPVKTSSKVGLMTSDTLCWVRYVAVNSRMRF